MSDQEKDSIEGNKQKEEETKKKGVVDAQQNEYLAPTVVEWGARALSAGVLLLLISYVLWSAFQPSTPVGFTYQVMIEQLDWRSSEWVLPIKIKNKGSVSVHELIIIAELVDLTGQVVDEAEMTTGLLGQGEEVLVELWFLKDPREFDLRFNVHSYKLP